MATYLSVLALERCRRTAPIENKEESQAKKKGREKSGMVRTGSEHKILRNFSNAFSHSGVQTKSFCRLFPDNSKSGDAISENDGT